jgi:hypothetical protein
MLGLGYTTFKTTTALGTSLDGVSTIFDDSDLTSMFVGRDGSGDNISPGEAVGLQLDKTYMGSISAAEYIASRPNFADNFTNSDNWGLPNQGVTDNGNGTLTIADVGGTDGILSFQTTNSVGDWVYLSVNITSATATNIGFRERNSSGAGTPLGSSSTSGAGVFTAFYKAGYANSNFALQVISTDTSATIDSFEVKIIPGQHRAAAADNERPVLDLTTSVYSNDYDNVDDDLSFDFEGGAGPADCSVFYARDTGSGWEIVEDENQDYSLASSLSMADIVGATPNGKYIGPIIVETSKLTNSLRRSIETYLKRKAGL